ncbi:MAG: HAD family hydrolase [Nanoarchaeota archaeon]
MKYKAVIFDFDNTLEDFLSAESLADVHLAGLVAKEYGLEPRDFLRTFNELKMKRVHANSRVEEYSRILWVSETLALMGMEGDYDFIDRCVDAYWKVIEKEARLYPNAKKVLSALKKKYKLGMITDSDGNVQVKTSRLKKIGVMPFFDAIVTSDETGFTKPYLENFSLLCKKLKVDPKNCVMVGDSASRDLAPAKKLGMVTIWTKQSLRRDSTYLWVDYEIADIGEVPGIVEGLEKR